MVNGVGGLDDASLEASVTMVRLPSNMGPAGGFCRLDRGLQRPVHPLGLSVRGRHRPPRLPSPRLVELLGRIERRPRRLPDRDGAVVPFGSSFVPRSHTVNVVPPKACPGTWHPVKYVVGGHRASREVVDAGILPDIDWYFGLEDFDFYCRMREAGFDVLVDARSPGRWLTSSPRSAGTTPCGHLGPSMSTRRGGPTTTPATSSPSPGVTANAVGTPGTCPTRPGASSGPARPSGGPSSTGSSTAPGGSWANTPVMPGGPGRSRPARTGLTPSGQVGEVGPEPEVDRRPAVGQRRHVVLVELHQPAGQLGGDGGRPDRACSRRPRPPAAGGGRGPGARRWPPAGRRARPRSARTGAPAAGRCRSAPPPSQGPVVEAPVHGVGDGRPVGGHPDPALVGQAREEPVDRVADQHQQSGRRGGAAQQRRHPGQAQVVGGPLPAQGARAPGGTIRRSPGRRPGPKGRVAKRSKKWRSLWMSGRVEMPGMGGQQLVPPGGARPSGRRCPRSRADRSPPRARGRAG